MVKLVSFVLRQKGREMLKLSEQFTSVQEVIAKIPIEPQKL